MNEFEKTEGPPRYLSLSIVIGTLLLYSYISLNRFVAVDEGYYLMAGRLVVEGMAPYVDFFYPQMPLLPYLHSSWISIFGASWEGARIFSALFATGVGFTLFYLLAVRRSLFWGIVGLILLLTNGMILGWFTVAKTYCFAALPLILSYFLFTKKDGTDLTFILSGLLLGLAVDVRLFYIILVPVYILYALFVFRYSYRSVAFFILGGGIAALPHFYFMIVDFDSYWFNNVGYHLIRSHRSPTADIISRQNITSFVTGLKPTERLDGIQLPFLFYLNLFAFGFSLIKRTIPSFATVIGLSLFFFYFVPDPIHVQYFSTVIPYFIIGSVEFFAYLSKDSNKKIQGSALLLTTLAIVISVIPFPGAIERFTETGRGVKGIDKNTIGIFTLDNVQAISDEITNRFPEDAKVLSQWPGFLFATPFKPIPGLENQFWVRVSRKISEEERKRYHILSDKELRALVRSSEVNGVVIEKRKIARYFGNRTFRKEDFDPHYTLREVPIYIRKKTVNDE